MGYIGNPPAERYTSIDKQTITGDGTVGPYTLTHSVGNAQEIEVFINNVRQEPAVAYTVAADQLTMTGTVDAADDFYVVFQGKAKMTAIHPSTFDLTAANGTFTGNVGIGTSSPSEELTISKSDDARISLTSSSTIKASMTSLIEFDGSDGRMGYVGPVSGEMRINTDGGYPITFRPGGNEHMRINSNGRLGIGTTSPSYELEVNTANGGGLSVVGASDVNSGWRLKPLGNDLYISQNGISDNVTFQNGGNVGIGTTSPTADLHISYGSGSGLLIEDTTNSPSVKSVVTSGNTESYFGATSNHAVVFLQNNTERMQIDSSGNVLVAKTTATTVDRGVVLRNNGEIYATQDGDKCLVLNRKTSDGQIASLRKDNTEFGSIGVINGNNPYIANDADNSGLQFGTGVIVPTYDSASQDNSVDLGSSSTRFKNLYLSGGVYLGGTAAANQLDDYEEGTFTPALGGSGTTYTLQRGNYVKVGNVVYINFDLRINSIGSGTTDHFGGLPFASTYESAISIEALTNLATAVSYINFRISGTAIYAYFSASSTTWTTLTANPSYLGNGTVIQGSGVYMTS